MPIARPDKESLEEFGCTVLSGFSHVKSNAELKNASHEELGKLFWDCVVEGESVVVNVPVAKDAKNQAVQDAQVPQTASQHPNKSVATGTEYFGKNVKDLFSKIFGRAGKAKDSNLDDIKGNQYIILATAYKKLMEDDKHENIAHEYRTYLVPYMRKINPLPATQQVIAEFSRITDLMLCCREELIQWFVHYKPSFTKQLAEADLPGLAVSLRKKFAAGLMSDLKDDKSELVAVDVKAYFREPTKFVDIVCKANSAAGYASLLNFFQPVRDQISEDQHNNAVILRNANIEPDLAASLLKLK